MHAVRCAGCSGRVAVSEVDRPLRSRIYHDAACAFGPECGPNEERNDIWQALADAGATDTAIAASFGVGRTAVNNVLLRHRAVVA